MMQVLSSGGLLGCTRKGAHWDGTNGPLIPRSALIRRMKVPVYTAG